MSSVVIPGFTISDARARISAARTHASRIKPISLSVLILMAIFTLNLQNYTPDPHRAAGPPDREPDGYLWIFDNRARRSGFSAAALPAEPQTTQSGGEQSMENGHFRHPGNR